MAASTLKELYRHRGHLLSLVEYGDGDSYTLECEYCHCVVLEFTEDGDGILKLGAHKSVKSRAIEEFPKTGTLCSVCGKPQYKTPAGVVCKNGHGGAPPLAQE